MADLERLEDWATPLLQKLSASERRKLAIQLARKLRHSQQQRIKDQKNPDGSDYAPRKAQQKQGRIKRRAMFARLRQNRYLRTQADAHELTVGFVGRVSRLARVHQEGLRDRIRRGGPEVRYEQRQLLGYSAADEAMILDMLVDHLGQ